MIAALIWIAVAASLFYYYCIKPLTYWKDRGVKQGRPVWLFGDLFHFLFRLRGLSEQQKMFYDRFPETRYSGVYNFTHPELIVRDPDLIKQIAIKDFDHFMDRKPFVPKNNEPLWGKNLVLLEGQEWKEMRNITSPSFTGSKMKIIFNLTSESVDSFLKHFLKKDNDVVEVDVLDIVTCFTNDSIAKTVFGIHVDSLENKQNEFLVNGKMSLDFGFLAALKIFGYGLLPSLYETFKIKIIAPSVTQFFIDFVQETMNIRKEKGIVRPDMLHLLMEAQKNTNKKDIFVEDIAAQAFIFYVGGFDTVSSLLCYLTYEVAVNTKVQQKLRREIEETTEKCGGKLTYDALSAMKYMDMVVSETLRKWPSMASIQRVCTKPYTIEPLLPNEKPVIVDKGVEVTIPIYGLHWDPQYYPDPEKFAPERFSEENKANFNQHAYLPFGIGPRACPGNRFALMEAKTLIFHLLYYYEVIPVAKSILPVTVSKSSFSLKPSGKLILGLKRITRNN